MSDNSLIIRIGGDAKEFLNEVDKIKKQTAELEKVLGDAAKVSGIAFAAIAASAAIATKAYADYETALVGVGKTTDIEGKRLDDFGKKFKEMSTEIPIATNELLGIAQAAGQLGVKGESNLLKFTETIAKLGVATDLTGEEAATALTRILNVTGEGIDTIDKFGSVIVALGNNFAASESEITHMTTEVARATSVFGVSAAEAAALGTAMRSMGIRAELGGSAIGRTMRTIEAAIRAGGSSIENLSKITGIAIDDLKTQFDQDAAGVFQRFTEGLGSVVANGGSAAETLATFGLRGDEIQKVLPVMAQNAELVGRAFSLANQELMENNALNAEAEKAFATLNSEFQRTQNNLTNIASNIGEALAPAITELFQGVNSLLKEFQNLDEEALSNIATFIKWGAAITAGTAGTAAFLLAAIKARQILKTLTIAFQVSRVAVIGFTSAATLGLSAVLAFLPEIISGVSSLVKSFNESREKPKTLEDINAKLSEINEQIDEINAKKFGASSQELFDVKKLQEERKELEKLRDAAIAATADFGTGELLVKPEASTSGMEGLGLDQFGISEGKIPFAPDEDAVQNTKKQQEDVLKTIDEQTQKRINLAKAENAVLKQLSQDRVNGLTQDELALMQKKADINKEIAKASQIENEQERALALENINLQHEQELAAIQEFEETKDARAAERRETRKKLEEELREVDQEELALLTEQDMERLTAQLQTETDIKKQFLNEDIANRVKALNQYASDEKKYGKTIAELNQFFQDEKVQGFKGTSQQLAQLAQSENATMKGIGKAAASTNAAMATAEGAIKAYSSLAGIPFVGPALGAAAAAALIAYGVEQQSKILAANTGGVVPFASGARSGVDSVPAMLTPGELVVPEKNFDEVVNSVASKRAGNVDGASSMGGTVININEMYGDEAFVNLMIDRIREQVLYKDAQLS